MTLSDTSLLTTDCAAYLDRLRRGGGNVTDAEVIAVDSLIRGLIFDGIRGKIIRLNWFIGSDMPAATTPQIVGAISGTVAGYEYDQNCGNPPFFSNRLNGGLSSFAKQHLNTGIAASSLPAYDIHLSAFYRRQPTNNWGFSLGASGSGNATLTALGVGNNPTEHWFYAYGQSAGAYKAATRASGALFVCGSIRSGSDYGFTLGDTAEMKGSPAVGRVMPETTFVVFGRNSADNAVWMKADCDLYGYTIGSGLTEAEVKKLKARLETLNKAIGR